MLHQYNTRYTKKMFTARVALERIQPDKFNLYPDYNGPDDSDTDSMDGYRAITLTELLEETMLTPPFRPYWILSSPSPVPNREQSPTPSLEYSAYNSTVTLVDVDHWFDNWNENDDDSPESYEDDADSELIALMEVDTNPITPMLEDRATTAELLGDSPVMTNSIYNGDYELQTPYLEDFPTNIFESPSTLLTLVGSRSSSPAMSYLRMHSPDYRPTPPATEEFTDVWPSPVSRAQHAHLPPKKAYIKCLRLL